LITTNLSEISQPIKNEFEDFNVRFKHAMKSNVGLVDLIARYIIRQKGKKIRPILVLLSAKVSGGISERTYRGAVLVEFLHTATLIHDDVVDNAEKRRGLWSVNAVFKNKAAVLMGDYLLSRGLSLAVEGKDYDFLGVITNTVRRMAEGELLQIQKTRKLDIDEQTYFRVIKDKTASLLETCCQVGALSNSDNFEYVEAMRVYGESLGIAFQIKDDTLDYDSNYKLFGKKIGSDIKEKKITLPLIYSFGKVSKDEVQHIKRLIKNGKDKKNVEMVIDFVKTHDGLNYALDTASQYAQKARNSLKVFPESQSRIALESLVDFVINRKN
jgi:octaprenyl-diphosphate synthase